MFKRAVAPSHAHKFACSVIWLFTVWCSAFPIMNSKPSASTLEVVVYNPMVANCKTRVQQICNELHNAHVICLPGTAKKHDPLLNTCVDSHMGRFTSHSWGWKKNQGINKSCGTTILVRRDLFPIKNFKCHYHPPDKLLGRAGAVRYCRDNMDVTFACTYIAPRTDKKFSKVNADVAAWMTKLRAKLANRSVLIICMDANSHLGQDIPGVCLEHVVGKCDATKENANGTMLREWAVDNRMCLVNTFFSAGPTFFPDKANGTRTEYISVRSNEFNRVKSCGVWMRSGDKLQPFPSKERREHRPLCVSIECELQYTKSCPDAGVFDKDLLMKGILHGFRVNDFLYQVDLLARQAQNNSEWKEILKSFSTIDAYDFILGKLKPVSLAFYSKQMKKSPEQKAIQQTIDSCLAERGQCMSEFLNVKNKSEHMSLKHWFRFWTIGHKLRVADSKAKKLNAFMYSERKKSLSEEIAYAKKQNDSSHMWQCTKALAGKPLHSHNG